MNERSLDLAVVCIADNRISYRSIVLRGHIFGATRVRWRNGEGGVILDRKIGALPHERKSTPSKLGIFAHARQVAVGDRDRDGVQPAVHRKHVVANGFVVPRVNRPRHNQVLGADLNISSLQPPRVPYQSTPNPLSFAPNRAHFCELFKHCIQDSETPV